MHCKKSSNIVPEDVSNSDILFRYNVDDSILILINF